MKKENQGRIMKRALILILPILFLLAFVAGCSSSKNSNTGTTAIPGTWAITGTLQCGQSCGSGVAGTYQVVFVSSPCTVVTPVGTFSVQGNTCFIANNNSAQGSISGKGLLTSANNNGVGVLIGADASPVPDGSTINLLFVMAPQGSVAEFTGTATVTKNTMQGSGACSSATPACQGGSATFSGTEQ
jgi:hypothetical protein